MGLPARQFDEKNESDQQLSGREKADQAWGMADNPTLTEAGVGYRSPLEKAREGWGEASVIDGDGDDVGNDSDPEIQKHLSNAEQSTAPITHSKINGGDAQGDRHAIDDNESTAGAEADDIPYNPQSKKSLGGIRNLRAMASKKAKMAIAGAAVSVVITVVSFIALLPVKLVHVAENLQDRFLSMGQSAVEERGERLMGRYLRKHVLPNVKNGTCKSTIDRNCVSRNIDGNNPASKLFNAWRESNFETKLATEYGVEFYNDGSGVSMRTKAIAEGVNIDDFVDGNNDDLFESKNLKGRANVRNSYRDAIQDKSRLKQAWNRFKVGTLLEKKYGLKRCVFACTKRDNFDDWKQNKKRAFKMALIYRVVEPNSQAYSAIIECLINQSCDQRDGNDKTGGKLDETTLAEDGVDNITRRLTQQFGRETADEIIEVADAILKKGVLAHIIETVISKVFGKAAGTTTTTVLGKAVPIVGWIDLAVTIYDLARNGKKVIAAARFAMIASTAVPTFYLLLSHANEIKSGNIDPEIVESAMASLNPPETDEQGAEISPLFNEIMGGEAPAVSFFNQRVYASDGSSTATPQNEVQKCNDGKDISPTRLVCEEESLGLSNDFLDTLDDFMGNFGIVDVFVSVWNSVVRPVYNLVENIIGWVVNQAISRLPGIDTLIARGGDFIIRLLKILFNLPEVDKMSGAQFFNSVGAGAAVTGVHSASFGIGAGSLNKTQVIGIAEKQHEQKVYAFKQKSLFTRLSNRDEGRSLVSQVAMVMPGNFRGLKKSVANYALNPMQSYSLTLASATSTSAVANGAVYGTQTYNAFTAYDMKPTGIPLDDPVLDADPEDPSLFSEEACQAEEERWLNVDNFDIDPDTQYAYPKTVNRCRLEKTAVCATGAAFATKLTDVCEEGDQSGGSQSTPTTPGDTDVDPTEDTSEIACPAGTEDGGVHQDYGPNRTPGARIRICGIPGAIPADRGVNSSAAANALAMIESAKSQGVNLKGNAFRSYETQISLRRQNCGSSEYAIYQMSANSCKPPTAKPGNSMHEVGLAIDFSNCSSRGTACYKWLAANASNFGFKNLPSEAWHWSTNGS